MIKKIINKIKSWFTSKEEMDPHEVMLHPKKPDVPIYVEKKPEHCSSHLRYRKSCPRCQEIVK
jgi:hypothetical protein|tara:strand:+ start:288 stop:476 length:189 start_codon:yes stop_codon:yes gene_type:complete